MSFYARTGLFRVVAIPWLPSTRISDTTDIALDFNDKYAEVDAEDLLVGPFIGSDSWRPFDSVTARLVTIGILWALTLFVMLLIALLRARRDRKMTDEMADAVDVVEDDVVGEELVELKGKFKTALTELRKSKNGRKHLNQMPWYIMIGPPGAPCARSGRRPARSRG